MPSAIIPHVANFHDPVQQPTPEEVPPTAPKKKSVSVKTTIADSIGIKVTNSQRKAWSYLTLGLPWMLETFSVFCSGIIYREKTDDRPLRVRFKSRHLGADKIDQLVKFQKLDHQTALALDEARRNKAIQIMHRIVNAKKTNPTPSESTDEMEKQAKMNLLLNLLEKCRNPKIARKDFNEENWKAMDLIDFEVTQDYINNLTQVFNSDWMNESGLRHVMHKDFGVDYYDALVAETLSLALAYIEGVEGKKINIPIFDPSLGTYRAVAYEVRLTRLGDALPCYILESEDPNAHPWLVVRGTQSYTGISAEGKELRRGAFESILADALDHECISRNLINKALVCRPIERQGDRLVQKESLSDIFRHWQRQGKKVNLCGHSLGGTLVNALTVEFYEQIKTAYSFSGAGVSRETSIRWDQLTEQDVTESYRTKLFSFDYEGDFIPSGGRRLIGNHLAVSAVNKKGKKSLYETHILPHLNRDFQVQKVDVFKENHKLARHLTERFRIIVGRCFRILLQFFNNKYVPEWWTKRKIYREYVSFERKIRHVFATSV